MIYLILTISLILRLVYITESLWLDEAIQALALMGRYGPILTYALSDFQPPLYHLLGIAWTSLAGYSELSLRAVSLLAGLGTVGYVYQFANLLGGRRVAVLAGWLAATNPLLIYYSQEGRTYALTAFLLTASFYYLYRLLHPQTTSRALTWGYLIFTAGALWTSYIAWITVALQGIYLLSRKDFRLLRWVAAASATLILWLPSFVRSLGIGISTTEAAPAWGKIVGGISAKAIALTWVKFTLGRISFDSDLVYAAAAGLVLIFHLYLLRRSKPTVPLLWVWLLGPLLLTAMISLWVPVYSYVRVLFLLPAYLLLLSLCLARQPIRLLAWFAVAIQLAALGYYWITPRFHREDWRSLVQDLNEAPPGRVGMPSLNQSSPLEYYRLNLPLFEPKLGVSDSKQPVYYLKYVEDLFDPFQAGRAKLLEAGYTNTGSKTYTGLQVDYYEIRP